MTSVQVTSQINIDLDQLLAGVAQLETSELEKFAEQVNQLLAQRQVDRPPAKETELIQPARQECLADEQSDIDDDPKKEVLESLRQAWQEVKAGETIPLSQMWEGIDA